MGCAFLEPMKLKLASWNVNGIRACVKNGFIDWMQKTKPTAVALQESRALLEQLPKELSDLGNYHQEWFPAEKKGYSGTAILSLEKPKRVIKGIGLQEFDGEGRALTAEFDKYFLCSAYFPNSREGGARIAYKVEFCKAIHRFAGDIMKKHKKPVVIAGDYNIAHYPIDLARPDDNENSPGFLPEEREWMTEFIETGWVDSFRNLHPKKVQYSWWSARTRARDRNIGWRIDYHCLHSSYKTHLKDAWIEDETLGSDHCPVWIELEF